MAGPAISSNDSIPGLQNEISGLYEQLDQLWIRYFDALEDYRAAQRTLKETLAAGFLSLSQANFSSSNKRFGRDYYDQRAVATTRVAIDIGSEDRVQLRIVSAGERTNQLTEDEGQDKGERPSKISDSATGSAQKNHSQLPTPSPTPEPELDSAGNEPSLKAKHSLDQDDYEDQDDRSSDKRIPPVNTIDTADPLRWFGILVPPALRAAQRSFIQATSNDECLAKSINSVRLLRDTEADIRRIRKTIRRLERGNASQ